MKKRIYFHPVRYKCSANCSFCITKERYTRDSSFPEFLNMNSEKYTKSLDFISENFQEIEITGGGEPLIHKNICNLLVKLKIYCPKIYIKLYTNGMQLIDIPEIDEINVSRVHENNEKNKQIMKNSSNNFLNEILEFYRTKCKKLRLQIPLLKNYYDSINEIKKLTVKYSSLVDVFMFRELFPNCSRSKNLFVELNSLKFEDKKIKWDDNSKECEEYPILYTDGNIYNNWTFEKKLTF